MDALIYEHFLRDAFSMSMNKDIGRGQDPAGLAEANIMSRAYNVVELNKLKVGIGYAIAIYNNKLSSQKQVRDPDDYESMDEFLNRALQCNNSNDIVQLIREYKSFMKDVLDLPDRIY